MGYYGASTFWIRDRMLTDPMKAGFFETWQTKLRDLERLDHGGGFHPPRLSSFSVAD
jgi:hypothetical protein